MDLIVNTPKICTATTLRSSYTDTVNFVYYYLNSGIDHMYLFFDDPEDKAISALEKEAMVTCFKCDQAYWGQVEKFVRRDRGIRGYEPGVDTLNLNDRQITNANFALKLARERGYDWIVHVDSDELVYPLEDLRQQLKKIDQGISEVRFNVREAIASKLEYKNVFEEVTIFKKSVSKIRILIAQGLGCSLVLDGEYFRGHKVAKCAVRTNSKIVSMSIHNPFYAPGFGKAVKSKSVKLLHFDNMGFESWKKKWQWRLDGTAAAPGMRENRLKQMNMFRECHESVVSNADNELKKLYKLLNTPSKYQFFVLGLLKMTEKCQLSHERFLQP